MRCFLCTFYILRPTLDLTLFFTLHSIFHAHAEATTTHASRIAIPSPIRIHLILLERAPKFPHRPIFNTCPVLRSKKETQDITPSGIHRKFSGSSRYQFVQLSFLRFFVCREMSRRGYGREESANTDKGRILKPFVRVIGEHSENGGAKRT